MGIDTETLQLEMLRYRHYEHVRDNYRSPDCPQCSTHDGYHFLFDNGESDIIADEQRMKKLEALLTKPLKP